MLYLHNLHYEKFSDGALKCIEDSIPFKIPNSWSWERLGNISSIARGGSPRPINDYLTNSPEGVNWIKIGDTEKDGKYIYKTKEKIKKEGISKSRLVHKGDFLLTNSMSFGRPYILKTDGCIHDGWLVIGNIDGIFDQDYLYYALSSNFMYAELSKVASGSTVQNLKSDTVKNVLFPIPPIHEQKIIASKISSLLNFIDRINEGKEDLITIIQKTKSKILDLAIRGKLVLQDSNDEPASVLLERIRQEKEELIKSGKLKRDKRESVIFRGEDNSYYEKLMGSSIEKQIKIPFDLPNGWVWGRGWDCFSGMTNTIPTGIDFDYIDIDSIDNREHKITKPKHLNVSDAPSRAKRAVYTGSVLFSLVRPYLQNIARVSEKHKDCIASTGFYVCNSNGVLSSEYLFYLMISPYVINGLNQFMKGDNSPSINKDDIENWLYPIPPLKEQKRITYQIEKLLTQLTKIASALK